MNSGVSGQWSNAIKITTSQKPIRTSYITLKFIVSEHNDKLSQPYEITLFGWECQYEDVICLWVSLLFSVNSYFIRF